MEAQDTPKYTKREIELIRMLNEASKNPDKQLSLVLFREEIEALLKKMKEE